MLFFDIMGFINALNAVFGPEAVAADKVTEDEMIKLICAMKHCSEKTARRYLKAYKAYHENDLSLQSKVDISHRPDESEPFDPSVVEEWKNTATANTTTASNTASALTVTPVTNTAPVSNTK